MLEGIGIALIIGLIVFAGLAYVIGRFIYVRIRFETASSNEALVITGPDLGDPKDPSIYKDDEGRYVKVVRGGGHLRKRFQTVERVPLRSFQIYMETPEVRTLHKVGVFAKATATVTVAETLEGVVKYAEQFLGKDPEDIQYQIEKVLDTSLRAILSQMSVEDINSNMEDFNKAVRKIAQEELTRMGFQITSLGLSEIWDDHGYLENLGAPQVAEIAKQAEIAKAESRRETELKQAEVDEEVAREKYQREMNIAESRKEKELKDADILAQTEKERAVAEAAYGLEQEERRLAIEERRLQIREQEKRKELEIRELERENEVRLQARQVELEEQQVEVRKKQADADYYATTREAEAIAQARIADGKAEAQVIREKSMAEVEAIEKRAEAMAKHQDVILSEKVIEMLPVFAEAVSKSLSGVESIRILDGGNGEQVRSLPMTVTNTMTQLQESLGQMTGFDLEGLLQNISAPKENPDRALDALNGLNDINDDTSENEEAYQ